MCSSCWGRRFNACPFCFFGHEEHKELTTDTKLCVLRVLRALVISPRMKCADFATFRKQSFL